MQCCGEPFSAMFFFITLLTNNSRIAFCFAGMLSQDVTRLQIKMAPEHYLQVNVNNTPQVEVMCTLQDTAGKAVPLAGCSFQEYYNFNHYWHINNASLGFTRRDRHIHQLKGQYYGHGLNFGECGITLTGYKNRGSFILGCRLWPVRGASQTAAMLLVVTGKCHQQKNILEQLDSNSGINKDILHS